MSKQEPYETTISSILRARRDRIKKSLGIFYTSEDEEEKRLHKKIMIGLARGMPEVIDEHKEEITNIDNDLIDIASLYSKIREIGYRLDLAILTKDDKEKAKEHQSIMDSLFDEVIEFFEKKQVKEVEPSIDEEDISNAEIVREELKWLYDKPISNVEENTYTLKFLYEISKDDVDLQKDILKFSRDFQSLAKKELPDNKYNEFCKLLGEMDQNFLIEDDKSKGKYDDNSPETPSSSTKQPISYNSVKNKSTEHGNGRNGP